MLVPVAAAVVALAAALAGYVMVKFYGVVFLGQPREANLAEAHDAGIWERAGLVWLAAGCIAARRRAGDGDRPDRPGHAHAHRLRHRPAWRRAGCSSRRSARARELRPLLFLAGHRRVLIALAWLAVRLFYHGRVRRAPPWDCGFPQTRTRACRTRAEGFGQPMRQVFEPFFRIAAQVPTPLDARPRYRVTAEDHLWYWLYLPVARGVGGVTRLVTLLQRGRISVYLTLQLRHAARAAAVRPMISWPPDSSPNSPRSCSRCCSRRMLTGWVNQCRAWLQNKSGPGSCSPTACSTKLFGKDVVLAHNASPLFRVAPYVIFGCMALAAAIVPMLGTDLPLNAAADAIALVGMLALARVFISLAAMDIGTAFGTLGARREMMVGFLAEPALLMVLFTASLISHSTSLATIVETLAHLEFVIYPSLAFAGVAFTMVSLAENARIPVDNPATHLELTMIHEAMVLEYSGRHLALIEWAASLKLFVYSCIGIALFFPFGIAEGGDALGLLLALPVLVAQARGRRLRCSR